MIPMTYFLIPYFIFAFLGFLFLIFNVFHVAKFGLQSAKTTIVLSTYVVSFLFIGILSVVLVFSYDWSGTLQTSSLFQSGGSTFFEL